MGEIFLEPKAAIPNARRDGFEENPAWDEIRNELDVAVATPYGKLAYRTLARAAPKRMTPLVLWRGLRPTPKTNDQERTPQMKLLLDHQRAAVPIQGAARSPVALVCKIIGSEHKRIGREGEQV
ncbi:hypothetical protein ACNJYD_10100 [Bradyrhizobium sp. DASA03005]|uniref:hypothetical protein n=1 Tax=Bradyrhizobium sp. SPXBL-02 TaxID=3395912 RepID=UPI003F718AE2